MTFKSDFPSVIKEMPVAGIIYFSNFNFLAV